MAFLYTTGGAERSVVALTAGTGEMYWTYGLEKGELSHATCEDDSWRYTGNTGVWGQITVNPEMGMLCLPVETPTHDQYGRHRPRRNLFGDSLLALDLETGGAPLALSACLPRHLGLGASLRTDSGRSHRGRARDQSGRPTDQAGVVVRVLPRDRRARVADRGVVGPAGRRRRAGRVVLADAACSDQTTGV